MELGELLVESDWAAAMEYLKTVSFSIGRLVLGLILFVWLIPVLV